MPGSSPATVVNPSAAVTTDSTMVTIQTSASARSAQPVIESAFVIVVLLLTQPRE